MWRHSDQVRFWESDSGAGPRATPTIGDGRVYAFCATGILNALDARGGSVVWPRNVASHGGKKAPTWGFSSSPLVVGVIVIVAAGGSVAAYDLATGEPSSFGPKGRYRGRRSVRIARIDEGACVVHQTEERRGYPE